MSQRIVRRLLGPLCLALALLGLSPAASEAASVPRVTRLSISGQDWYDARLTVRWKAVRGATYQVRWSSSPRMRSATAPLRTRSPRGTSIGPLDRGKPWYFQARAVRKTRHGVWSKVRRGTFTNKWPSTPSL